MPYVFMPPSHYDLVHTVIRSVKAAFPDFKFTSAQFNIGLCAGLHTDSANVGPSMIVAVGPHAGGNLWLHQPGEGKVHYLQTWTPINGRIPHRNLPFFGKRGSIVLFTHSALCAPVVSAGTVKVVEDLVELGFPVPSMPIKTDTSAADLLCINEGLGPAAISFKMLCESTLQTTSVTTVGAIR